MLEEIRIALDILECGIDPLPSLLCDHLLTEVVHQLLLSHTADVQDAAELRHSFGGRIERLDCIRSLDPKDDDHREIFVDIESGAVELLVVVAVIQLKGMLLEEQLWGGNVIHRKWRKSRVPR